MVFIDSKQLLIPKQVYIGDTAEIHCSFTSSSTALSYAVSQNKNQLSPACFLEDLDFSKYDLKNIMLTSTGANNYTLVVSFVPWTTEKIQLPAYDLSAAVDAEPGDLLVNFDSVSIVSITQQNNVKTIKSFEAPKLLPGTIYRIYGVLIALVIFVIAVIRLIVKRHDLAFFFKNKRLLRRYRKNQRQTIRALNGLLKKQQLSDHDLAEAVQAIMRKYLETRFEYPFTHKVASEIITGLNEATLGSIFETEEREKAAETIGAAFIRTDFIRYSAGGRFKQDEKKELISGLSAAINAVERKIPDPEENSAEGENINRPEGNLSFGGNNSCPEGNLSFGGNNSRPEGNLSFGGNNSRPEGNLSEARKSTPEAQDV